MVHDVPPSVYLVGIGIPAIASIVVALVSRRWGNKVTEKDEPFKPSDHSEHARTRDAVHAMRREMHLRFDAIQDARGMEREQEQIGRSAQNVFDQEK